MTPHRAQHGFTLIEIMIVIAITGIIIAITTTTMLRQREIARGRSCQENLSKIDGAKEQYAIENKADQNYTPVWDDLVSETLYLRFTPECPAGGSYEINNLNTVPACDYELPAFMNNVRFAHQVQNID